MSSWFLAMHPTVFIAMFVALCSLSPLVEKLILKAK